MIIMVGNTRTGVSQASLQIVYSFFIPLISVACWLSACCFRGIIIVIVDTEENRKCPIFYGNESSGDVVLTNKNS
jgi:hypothetical protein